MRRSRMFPTSSRAVRELCKTWKRDSAQSCSLPTRMRHCRAVPKVTFIGAGSVEFTRNVVTDLCGYPELAGNLHLALHDISPGRLAFAEELTRQIVAQTGAGARVT